jgi:hypothetical protein
MQFQSLVLGGGELLFASTNTVRLPFQFPSPIRGVYAILRRTRFERPRERGSYYSPGDDDRELSVLEVSLLPIFDALQSQTSGQVQIHFRLPSSTTRITDDLIHAEIEVLVIGV